MGAKFKITIAEPCQQQWGNMQSTSTGRFCSTCEKDVTDFTNFTDQELVKWFKENQELGCGRLNPEQLDRLIIFENKFSIRRFKPNWIAASIIAFLSFPKLIKANVIKSETFQYDGFTVKEFNQNKEIDSLKTIKGKVIDKDELPLQSVSIRVLGGKYSCSTNEKGEFILNYSIENVNDVKELDIRYIGYENKIVKIKPDDKYCLITLTESSNAFMGEVVIVRTTFWRKVYFKMKNQIKDINPFLKKT